MNVSNTAVLKCCHNNVLRSFHALLISLNMVLTMLLKIAYRDMLLNHNYSPYEKTTFINKEEKITHSQSEIKIDIFFRFKPFVNINPVVKQIEDIAFC